MRQFIFIASFFLVLIALNVQAQSDTAFFNSEYPIDDDVAYKGGMNRMNKVLQKSIKYPERAIRDSVSGTVYVYFTIDTCGHSTDIKIIRGVREDIDNEAMRGVDLLDEWIPGQCNGKKVNSHYMLPVSFSLSTKKE